MKFFSFINVIIYFIINFACKLKRYFRLDKFKMAAIQIQILLDFFRINHFYKKVVLFLLQHYVVFQIIIIICSSLYLNTFECESGPNFNAYPNGVNCESFEKLKEPKALDTFRAYTGAALIGKKSATSYDRQFAVENNDVNGPLYDVIDITFMETYIDNNPYFERPLFAIPDHEKVIKITDPYVVSIIEPGIYPDGILNPDPVIVSIFYPGIYSDAIPDTEIELQDGNDTCETAYYINIYLDYDYFVYDNLVVDYVNSNDLLLTFEKQRYHIVKQKFNCGTFSDAT